MNIHDSDHPANSAPDAAPASSGPQIHQRLSYTSLPVNDGAVVKCGLYDMTDNELVTNIQGTVTAMTNNPRFPNPTPDLELLDASKEQLREVALEVAAVQTALRAVFAKRNAVRKVAEDRYRAVASYVQSASNGNANAIVSAGFQLRAKSTPVGCLEMPLNLNLTLNGSIGIMGLTWDPVPKARSYMIQISEAATMQRDWKPLRTSTSTKQIVKDLEPGKVYAFRVAAVGGVGGQSPWSVEVKRMAA